MGRAGRASGGSSCCVPLPSTVTSYSFLSPHTASKTSGKGQPSLQQLPERVMLSLSWVTCYKPPLAERVLLESTLARELDFSERGCGRTWVTIRSPLPRFHTKPRLNAVTPQRWEAGARRSWAACSHCSSQSHPPTSTTEAAQVQHRWSQSQVGDISKGLEIQMS